MKPRPDCVRIGPIFTGLGLKPFPRSLKNLVRDFYNWWPHRTRSPSTSSCHSVTYLTNSIPHLSFLATAHTFLLDLARQALLLPFHWDLLHWRTSQVYMTLYENFRGSPRPDCVWIGPIPTGLGLKPFPHNLKIPGLKLLQHYIVFHKIIQTLDLCLCSFPSLVFYVF